MALKGRFARPTSDGNFVAFVTHEVVRFFQLILALTVCGLYGVDLNNARKAHGYADSKWVYAEVTAGLAAVTALVYLALATKSFIAFGWDILLFILWIALFGVFGKLFIKEDPEGNGDIQRLKNAVWVDLVNALLWLITAIWGAVMFFFGRGRRSLHTGRATV
ncbi:hypothetical protein MMC25_003571 [Agyrium rufum]|nr:hypothetical protein [Agyrium rufum]